MTLSTVLDAVRVEALNSQQRLEFGIANFKYFFLEEHKPR
jgi:hypothetical protein